jgi:uncharacterized cofD-like protein
MLLSGLKRHPVSLTAIVSMADDGGSTGVLRDELGVLPPGDVRQCLVALSESEEVMRELFNYRFNQGGLKGHNFGNIFLSTLERITGSFEEAVRVVSSDVLKVRGSVVPVTTDDVELAYGDGEAIGEHMINEATITDPALLRLAPEARANPRAVEAIEAADLIVIGPGNLFCSIVPTLLVKGIPEAIASSKARVVYNCNLMTKKGHTDGYVVGDFVREIERHLGKGRIDFVTYNDTAPEAELLAKYSEEGTHPVAFAKEIGGTTYVPLPRNLVSGSVPAHRPGDPVRRTLIRHDHEVLAEMIVGLL